MFISTVSGLASFGCSGLLGAPVLQINLCIVVRAMTEAVPRESRLPAAADSTAAATAAPL